MKSKEKEDVLVIVAHPDDETIWMGGTLLRNKNKWNTSIISLCRRDDKDRAPKFRKVCDIYKAKSFMSDLEDETLGEIPTSEVKQRIPDSIRKIKWDALYTHGKNGEYGHKRHKIVHNAVEEMLKDKEIKAGKVFFFSYLIKGRFACANARADKFINLRDVELIRKKGIIKNVYGFDDGSFEVTCAKKRESFKIR